jgi:hypothetical protein
MDNPKQIIEEAREQGYYVRRNVDMTKQEFLEWCASLSTPWTEEIHKIHKETFDDNNIVTWSNKTRFKGHSLPWHADNPWHEKYKFPLRPFWAEKISSEKDIIYYLNITKWFEDQDKSTKEYFKSLRVLTQDYKGGCQPYWSSFVKKHPITGKESFNWGAMALDSKVFGLTADEGMWGPHFSYTMAIEKDNRELVQTPEIESWFSSMLTDRYLYGHQWKQKDLALMDNWVSLHYIGSQNYEQERILWRKTLLQPWHTG